MSRIGRSSQVIRIGSKQSTNESRPPDQYDFPKSARPKQPIDHDDFPKRPGRNSPAMSSRIGRSSQLIMRIFRRGQADSPAMSRIDRSSQLTISSRPKQPKNDKRKFGRNSQKRSASYSVAVLAQDVNFPGCIGQR